MPSGCAGSISEPAEALRIARQTQGHRIAISPCDSSMLAGEAGSGDRRSRQPIDLAPELQEQSARLHVGHAGIRDAELIESTGR
jgi:hypothetical protein